MTDLPATAKPAGRGLVFAFAGALLAATACFVGAVAELAALGREHSAPTGLLLGAAIAFSIGAIVLIRVAIHAEHKLRAMPRPAPAPSVRRPPKNGPMARVFAIVLVLGFVAVLIFMTLSLHASAVKSAETQHHGISRSATVTAVHRESHASRYDSWNTYNYDVQLSAAANGATTTVVNDPSRDFQRYDAGETTLVLVDPKELNYAELPGHPVQSSSWALAPIILAAVFLLTGFLIFVEQRKHHRMKAADPAGVVTNWK
jgi:hypothetical protein